MESSNSGSLQSSSGGGGGAGAGDNEEFDSTTQSIFNHLLRPPPPPPTDTTFYDSSSNPVHDLGSLWSRNFRPDPNFADFGSTQTQTQTIATYPNPSRMDTNTKTGRGLDHHVGVTTKNPKKRTRASRRAPTTVLTTDTTNFRQMVQEFTGIPTAPFSGAAFSRRLDGFGRAGDGGIGPSFPLRPAAQKIQQQQPSFLNSTANNITTSSNYQLPPSGIHEFQKQPSTLLDLQNPMLSFQSLMQTTIPQQMNGNTQQPNHLSGFPSSSKRWKGQEEKLESFEGVNGNTENIEGNEDSWISRSN